MEESQYHIVSVCVPNKYIYIWRNFLANSACAKNSIVLWCDDAIAMPQRERVRWWRFAAIASSLHRHWHIASTHHRVISPPPIVDPSHHHHRTIASSSLHHSSIDPNLDGAIVSYVALSIGLRFSLIYWCKQKNDIVFPYSNWPNAQTNLPNLSNLNVRHWLIW